MVKRFLENLVIYNKLLYTPEIKSWISKFKPGVKFRYYLDSEKSPETLSVSGYPRYNKLLGLWEVRVDRGFNWIILTYNWKENIGECNFEFL